MDVFGSTNPKRPSTLLTCTSADERRGTILRKFAGLCEESGIRTTRQGDYAALALETKVH